MGRFRSLSTGVVVSVADEKDDRFVSGWESADAPAKKAPAKKSAAKAPVKDAPVVDDSATPADTSAGDDASQD